MKHNTQLEKLKRVLKDKNCTVEKHSSVMEITFENTEDADWFQDIFEDFQQKSAVSCLMSMRPKNGNARHKFVFNVKDMDLFIEILE
jgi:hypothetical protein